MPPMPVRPIASMRNWVRMSRRRAPTAFRMPISRVRSFTETSMMFMIPMPPTSNEIPPIAPSRIVNVPLTCWNAASVSFWFVTVKSALAGSLILCRWRRMSVTSAVVFAI